MANNFLQGLALGALQTGANNYINRDQIKADKERMAAEAQQREWNNRPFADNLKLIEDSLFGDVWNDVSKYPNAPSIPNAPSAPIDNINTDFSQNGNMNVPINYGYSAPIGNTNTDLYPNGYGNQSPNMTSQPIGDINTNLYGNPNQSPGIVPSSPAPVMNNTTGTDRLKQYWDTEKARIMSYHPTETQAKTAIAELVSNIEKMRDEMPWREDKRANQLITLAQGNNDMEYIYGDATKGLTFGQFKQWLSRPDIQAHLASNDNDAMQKADNSKIEDITVYDRDNKPVLIPGIQHGSVKQVTDQYYQRQDDEVKLENEKAYFKMQEDAKKSNMIVSPTAITVRHLDGPDTTEVLSGPSVDVEFKYRAIQDNNTDVTRERIARGNDAAAKAAVKTISMEGSTLPGSYGNPSDASLPGNIASPNSAGAPQLTQQQLDNLALLEKNSGINPNSGFATPPSPISNNVTPAPVNTNIINPNGTNGTISPGEGVAGIPGSRVPVITPTSIYEKRFVSGSYLAPVYPGVELAFGRVVAKKIANIPVPARVGADATNQVAVPLWIASSSSPGINGKANVGSTGVITFADTETDKIADAMKLYDYQRPIVKSYDPNGNPTLYGPSREAQDKADKKSKEAQDRLLEYKNLAERIRSNKAGEKITREGQAITKRGQNITVRGQDINHAEFVQVSKGKDGKITPADSYAYYTNNYGGLDKTFNGKGDSIYTSLNKDTKGNITPGGTISDTYKLKTRIAILASIEDGADANKIYDDALARRLANYGVTKVSDITDNATRQQVTDELKVISDAKLLAQQDKIKGTTSMKLLKDKGYIVKGK